MIGTTVATTMTYINAWFMTTALMTAAAIAMRSTAWIPGCMVEVFTHTAVPCFGTDIVGTATS